MKQRFIALGLIVVGWFILDFVFHGNVLMADYEATAQLWRPMAEMKTGLMHAVTILTALMLIFIYCQLVRPKSLKNGLKLGLFAGLLVGIGMGLGSYSYMPITERIAAVWMIATLVKYLYAGYIVGRVVTTEMV